MNRAIGVILSAAALSALGAVSRSIAQQPPTPVDAVIVLAVDVSQSMDFEEHIFQRDGYSSAFRQPDVAAALLGGANHRVAVSYMQFAGAFEPAQVIPWTLIDSAAAADAFAETVRKLPPYAEARTSISTALTKAGKLIETSGYAGAGARKIVVVSGDGANAVGPPLVAARDALASQGVTIVGLPLMLNKPRQPIDVPELDRYFTNCVVGGPGGFMQPLSKPDDAAIALEKMARGAPSTPSARDAAYDCLVGEKAFAAAQKK